MVLKDSAVFMVVWSALSFAMGVFVGKAISKMSGELPVTHVSQLDDVMMRARGYEKFRMRCGHIRWINPQHFQPGEWADLFTQECSRCQIVKSAK